MRSLTADLRDVEAIALGLAGKFGLGALTAFPGYDRVLVTTGDRRAAPGRTASAHRSDGRSNFLRSTGGYGDTRRIIVRTAAHGVSNVTVTRTLRLLASEDWSAWCPAGGRCSPSRSVSAGRVPQPGHSAVLMRPVREVSGLWAPTDGVGTPVPTRASRNPLGPANKLASGPGAVPDLVPSQPACPRQDNGACQADSAESCVSLPFQISILFIQRVSRTRVVCPLLIGQFGE